MDTYYWVWGIGEDLQTDRLTVDSQYSRQDGRTYPSQLVKSFKVEDLEESLRLEILRRRLQKVKREAAREGEQ